MKNIFYKLNKKKIKITYITIGCLVLIGLILIPFSFAELTPVKSVNIYSENTSYEDNESGSWKIEKSGKWVSKGTAEVTFKVDTESMIKTAKTDVILVLDTSGSMVGDRINGVISDSRDLIENLFKSGDNRVGLVRFSNDSQILSDLTKDKDFLLKQIGGLVADGETNYYSAFVDVTNMLENYHKEDDRETLVLFLTDGLPNINTPNEVAQYNYLKSKYPWLIINGIQYEMGSTILKQIEKVTDNQFSAGIFDLYNVLFDASVPKLNYEEFTIIDNIDTRYFKVEKESDISVNKGEVKLDTELQKITWKIPGLRSGIIADKSKPVMTIKAKLKDELIGAGGVYPTNSFEEINTKIENQIENVNSTLTPILADNYKVIYDGNAPDDCNVEGIPRAENHSVFDTVDINDSSPTCEGYKFKGWKVTDSNIKKVGSNRFIMPEANVDVKAMWGKIELNKTTDGKVSEVQTIYEMMRDNSKDNDQSLDYYFEDFSKTSGIYENFETRDKDYPVYYYRGKVDNNLIFANMCWKIVRTTETGGTKLIYNGLPAGDGSCTNTGEDATIGKGEFSYDNDSIAVGGYKYGKVYDRSSKSIISTWYSLVGKEKNYVSSISATSYYYGDGVEYVDGVGYTLTNAKQYYWSDNYLTLDHYYTCLQEENGVCDKVYFILSRSSADGNNAPYSTGFYYVEMTNGETYENLYSEAEKVKWKFGNDVVYNGNTYTLVDPIEVGALAYYIDNNERDKVNNAHHYTCFTDTDKCDLSVYYIYSVSSYFYYITLTDGTKVEKALKEMTSESTNENNSAIIDKLNQWYEGYLKDTKYTEYIEDAVWCSDRSIYDLGGWDKDGNNTKNLYFGVYGRSNVRPYRISLECINETDRFSVSNSKAKLDYPVGLLTADEMILAGGGNDSYGSNEQYLYMGDKQLTSAPFYFDSYGLMILISSSGSGYSSAGADSDYYVRPSISIKPGAVIESGDGSESSPYILVDNFKQLKLYKISTNNSDISLKKFSVSGSKILIRCNIDGKMVSSFKMNGKLIKGNSFIMPKSDVSITDVVFDDVQSIIFESNHNPYPSDLDKEYTHTFEGATSLTVELEYETEDGRFEPADYINVYGKNDNYYDMYGGSFRKTEMITVLGDYIKILFHTNSFNNDYYGFKATITPNYD